MKGGGDKTRVVILNKDGTAVVQQKTIINRYILKEVYYV
jgi:hypothetical protein